MDLVFDLNVTEGYERFSVIIELEQYEFISLNFYVNYHTLGSKFSGICISTKSSEMDMK